MGVESMHRLKPNLVRTILVLLAVLLVPLVAGPVTAPIVSGQGGPLKVVTTISPIADLIRNVGGNRVQVTSLVPVGDGPEDYDPTPADAAAVAAARIYFANGLGLEEYLEDLIQSSGNTSLQVVALSDGLPTLTGFGQGAEEGGNPHLWMSVRNGMAYVDVIQQTLSQVDPDSAPTYQANAAQYTARLVELDSYIEQQVQSLLPAQRVLVSTHDAYPYFADRYGLRHLAIISANPDSDPTAQEYAALIQTVKDNNVKAVFGEAGFSDRFIAQLAADSGATYVADLYTDTLSKAPPADTYLGLMRYDADQIVAALK
jgi:manganese/iron transport system substrate-binding protein